MDDGNGMKSLILVVLVVGAALLVVRCTTPADTVRIRMTVVVKTPAGERTGSSVMELVLKRKFLIPMPGSGGGDGGGGFQLLGEAPFVELDNGQTLFSTMSGKEFKPRVESAALDGIRLFDHRRIAPQDSDERIFSDLNRTKSSELVRADRYPVFATFADASNPKSMTELLPDNLASLGQGYAIRSITVEVLGADQPLTDTLSTRFPALAKVRGLLALYPQGKGQHY